VWVRVTKISKNYDLLPKWELLLIRQYFPKKYDFQLITDERVTEVENILNNRPRKRYGFKTPDEVFSLTLLNNGIVALIT
jgi:IS30 family transposase